MWEQVEQHVETGDNDEDYQDSDADMGDKETIDVID